MPPMQYTHAIVGRSARRAARPGAGRGWGGLGGCLLALCLAIGPVAAAPPPWPDGPYSYFAENVPLEKVLQEFASSFSLTLVLEPGVTGMVNGRFTTREPTEFISRLGGVYGFTWYTHAGSLYVSKASDVITRSITMPGGALGNLRQALLDLGVLEPRFGWGELGDQGIVMVSGPPSYVRLLESTLKALPPGALANQVTVFRLRHASAEDRVILYRDKQVTQPGLATVLRQLLVSRGINANAASVTEAAGTPGALRPLGALGEGGGAQGGAAAAGSAAGSGVVPQGGAPATATVRGSGAERTRSASGSSVSIQSDPRLNALIIQDTPERMPLYAQLIAQLDVPTALIEIEAMIIDINSERARELGINWAARRGGTAVGFGNLQQPGQGTISVVRAVDAAANVNPSTLVVDAGNYLIGQIRALETKGDARIQSRPSVLTTDNIGALLDLSETFYIRVQGERVASVSPVTAGTTLKVTPRLIDGADPSIQLTIDIEDGQIQDRQVDSLPTVRRSTVSTQAIVRQNETLLIAGHSSDQNIDAVERVPVLGEIPGLGVLFSNKTRTVQKRERLFMIKPKVIHLSAAGVPSAPVGVTGPATAAATTATTAQPPAQPPAIARPSAPPPLAVPGSAPARVFTFPRVPSW